MSTREPVRPKDLRAGTRASAVRTLGPDPQILRRRQASNHSDGSAWRLLRMTTWGIRHRLPIPRQRFDSFPHDEVGQVRTPPPAPRRHRTGARAPVVSGAPPVLPRPLSTPWAAEGGGPSPGSRPDEGPPRSRRPLRGARSPATAELLGSHRGHRGHGGTAETPEVLRVLCVLCEILAELAYRTAGSRAEGAGASPSPGLAFSPARHTSRGGRKTLLTRTVPQITIRSVPAG